MKWCKDCKFWDTIGQLPSETGNCLRYPPTPNGEEDGLWPIVNQYNWCGEWLSRWRSVPDPPEANVTGV